MKKRIHPTLADARDEKNLQDAKEDLQDAKLTKREQDLLSYYEAKLEEEEGLLEIAQKQGYKTTTASIKKRVEDRKEKISKLQNKAK